VRPHSRLSRRKAWANDPVTKFSLVHERLFHAFIISRDLQFFTHSRPTWDNDSFEDDVTLPHPGMYRILADFYPEDATPQLVPKTLFVAGEEPPVAPLARDYSPKTVEDLTIGFSTTPASPVAGLTTQLRFRFTPGDDIEQHLGAWGHVTAASDDLIDLMHTHPSIADGGPLIQFDMVFPRARMYRLWVQVQRQGVVNTAFFDVPVRPFGSDPLGRSR
jgi:hypothetical protein